MRRWTIILLVGGIVCAATISTVGVASADHPSNPIECAFPFEATDATGTAVTIPEEPERVVTLNPSAAQTLWEIGAEEKVVGLSKHAMNLDGAEQRTNISTVGETINPEIVVELEPDLVLAPSSRMVTEELVETLRRAGLTVYYYPSAGSIQDVRDRTLLTGQLVGECEGATETAEWMDGELEIVSQALSGEERPDVLYVFFGFTAGSNTFIHEIIEASGGINLAAELGISEYEQVNEEAVVIEDPDWIVLNSNSPELPESEAYAQTTAVRENQTVVVNINHLNRPGPRIVHAITELAETLHPEAYAAAQAAAESTADEQTETESGESDTASTEQSTETTGGTEPEDQAGFGAAGALVALVVGLLAASRQTAGSGGRV